MTRTELRATLLVLVLVVVGVIALWPRGASSGDPGGSGGDAAPSVAAPASTSIEDARARAALAPCPAPRVPEPEVSLPAGPPALAGVVLDCLGAPGPVDLREAVAGHTTLLNLWASWCGPCRAEMPALAAYAARPGAVPVLGVAVADTPTSALSLATALDVHYPSVADPDRLVARRTGAAPVLPASVVVRADGVVVPLPPEVFASPDAVAAAVARAGA